VLSPFVVLFLLLLLLCVQAGCGECGGSGCSKRGNGLDGDDCCQSKIKKNGKKCSETGSAPCIVDEGERRSTTDWEIESIDTLSLC